MPRGPDVPPRLLILIAVVVALGGILLLDPFGGEDEPVAPPAPVEPVTEGAPPLPGEEGQAENEGGAGEGRGRRDGRSEPKEPGPDERAPREPEAPQGGGSPQERYLDCVAAAESRAEIKDCEQVL